MSSGAGAAGAPRVRHPRARSRSRRGRRGRSSSATTVGSWSRMTKSGFVRWTRAGVPSAMAASAVTSARARPRPGIHGLTMTQIAPATRPMPRPPNIIRARVPFRVMSPITSPFSVLKPTVSSWRIVANRITSRPPRPATTSPTMMPAMPPRAMSRRTSPTGDTARRPSNVVGDVPGITIASVMVLAESSERTS